MTYFATMHSFDNENFSVVVLDNSGTLVVYIELDSGKWTVTRASDGRSHKDLPYWEVTKTVFRLLESPEDVKGLLACLAALEKLHG